MCRRVVRHRAGTVHMIEDFGCWSSFPGSGCSSSSGARAARKGCCSAGASARPVSRLTWFSTAGTGDTGFRSKRRAATEWRLPENPCVRESRNRTATSIEASLRALPGNLAPFLRRLRERHPEHYRRVVDAVRIAAPFFGDFLYRDDRNPDDRMELEWFQGSPCWPRCSRPPATNGR